MKKGQSPPPVILKLKKKILEWLIFTFFKNWIRYGTNSNQQYENSETATETIFENIFSFLPEAPFSGVLQETSQIPIFQDRMSVRRTDFFPGAMFICPPNRYRFPRTLFWLPNGYRIFRITFFCYRMMTIFEAFLNINEQTGNFQEGTPLWTDIPAIGLSGCFRKLLL